ncbi:MAG: hypothetical protein M5U28_21310 [Sandaracinaceae bacterium]|nr:hypothetical protein [Sandaracinaceae bacterium]
MAVDHDAGETRLSLDPHRDLAPLAAGSFAHRRGGLAGRVRRISVRDGPRSRHRLSTRRDEAHDHLADAAIGRDAHDNLDEFIEPERREDVARAGFVGARDAPALPLLLDRFGTPDERTAGGQHDGDRIDDVRLDVRRERSLRAHREDAHFIGARHRGEREEQVKDEQTRGTLHVRTLP